MDSVDRDQWSKLNKLADELHAHEKGCAEWRGQMDARIENIESTIRATSHRTWAILVAAVGGLVSGLLTLLQ